MIFNQFVPELTEMRWCTGFFTDKPFSVDPTRANFRGLTYLLWSCDFDIYIYLLEVSSTVWPILSDIVSPTEYGLLLGLFTWSQIPDFIRKTLTLWYSSDFYCNADTWLCPFGVEIK